MESKFLDQDVDINATLLVKSHNLSFEMHT